MSSETRGSPAPAQTTFAAPTKKGAPVAKPVNIFTNDGSFLERFKKETVESKEKKQQEEALARKQKLDERFKNRGKRAAAPGTAEEESAKKKKVDSGELSTYQKELLANGDSLRDEGMGIRPILK